MAKSRKLPIKFFFNFLSPIFGLQLDVGGTWRNVCDDYIRTVELACQKMTGFHCNSVTCGYIDAGVDTQAVSVEGQATTCSSATQAMWVDCHKCYGMCE